MWWPPILIALAMLMCGDSSVMGDSLKVGAVIPLTGERSQIGEIEKNALIMAVDDINRAGGIRGRQVSIIIEDDNDQPDLARSAAEKLISEDGVIVLIGSGRSEAVLEIEKIAQERRVPCLETTSSDRQAPELDGNYVFHIAPPLSHYFGPLLSFLKEVVTARTLALVYENTDFGVKAAEVLSQDFTAMGGNIVGRESFELGMSDFRPILERVKQAMPDVIFIASSDNEGAILMLQFQDLDINPKLFVGCARSFVMPKFMLGAGEASDYVFTIDFWDGRLPYPGVEKFYSDFIERFLAGPRYFGAMAYACVQVIADALNRTSDLTPEGVFNREGVRSSLVGTDMNSVLGPVRFVSSGNLKQQNDVRMLLSQWQVGILEVVWPREFALEPYIFPVPPWSSRH